MTPKVADWADLTRLIDYIREFHAASPWSVLPYSTAVTRQNLQAMIASPESVIFVHDYGCIGGSLVPLKFSPGLLAQEMFWWAEKDGLSLLSAFEKWAKAIGASAICMADLPESRVAPIYRRRGYSRAENFYTKVI